MGAKKIIFTSCIATGLLLVGVFSAYYYGLFGTYMVLTKTNYENLSGWENDDHQQALGAFYRSCGEINKLNPNKPFSEALKQGGKVAAWQNICAEISNIDLDNSESAKKFFERWFLPYLVSNNFNTKGLFTGYYLPTLKCSLEKTAEYSVPIYGMPENLVRVDLEKFDKTLKGKKIFGLIKDQQLLPCPAREAIEKGALNNSAPVIAWCNDKIDVFFAQVQGSAIIELPTGERFIINYAAANGRPYTGLGKLLVKNKEIDPKKVSMQAIREWLLQHPDKMDAILNQNASYVFFRVIENVEPLGSQQVPLTAQRSMAIDKRYFSFGAPLWLDTVVPEDGSQKFTPFRRLLIAQDTGGAIKGVVRGDVYWGGGEQAALIAGHMKSKGRYWVLLPKEKISE